MLVLPYALRRQWIRSILHLLIGFLTSNICLNFVLAFGSRAFLSVRGYSSKTTPIFAAEIPFRFDDFTFICLLSVFWHKCHTEIDRFIELPFSFTILHNDSVTCVLFSFLMPSSSLNYCYELSGPLPLCLKGGNLGIILRFFWFN